MITIELKDLIRAHRAYTEARSRALESSQEPGGDATAAHQAELDYLRERVRLLEQARAKMLEKYEAEIGRYQQLIGEKQQLLREDAAKAGPVAEPAPANPPAKTPKSGSGRTKPAAKPAQPPAQTS